MDYFPSEQQAKFEAFQAALTEAQIDAKQSKEPVFIICCAGEPYCFLLGPDATSAMENECRVCERYKVLASGEWILMSQAKGIS